MKQQIEIWNNCDGTYTVSDTSGIYDDITVDSDIDAADEAEAMRDDLGLEIVKK